MKGLPSDSRSLITTVIIGKDSNVVNDFSEETQKLCEAFGLNYRVENRTLKNSSARYSIAIGWRWLIDDDSKTIVFHDSILPKLRGFNPLVTSLINGDTEIGVSVIFGEADFDTGDIINQRKTQVEYPIKISDAIKRVGFLYAEALSQLLAEIRENKIKAQPQNNLLATYSLWRDEDDYRIDWSKSSVFIKRFIDAVGYPYKGAYTLYQGKRVIIKDAVVADDVIIENRTPGKVLFRKQGKFFIVCGVGLLCVDAFSDSDGNSFDIKTFRARFQ